jgi:hypothetical protein
MFCATCCVISLPFLYLLYAICCVLPTVHNLLYATCCMLSAVCYPQYTTCCALPAACYLLFSVCYLPGVCFPPPCLELPTVCSCCALPRARYSWATCCYLRCTTSYVPSAEYYLVPYLLCAIVLCYMPTVCNLQNAAVC